MFSSRHGARPRRRALLVAGRANSRSLPGHVFSHEGVPTTTCTESANGGTIGAMCSADLGAATVPCSARSGGTRSCSSFSTPRRITYLTILWSVAPAN